MSVQSARLITEILDSINPGQVALVALPQEAGQGEYCIDRHGVVLCIGDGHDFKYPEVGTPVQIEALTGVRTDLTNISQEHLELIVDALGDPDLGGVVPLNSLPSISGRAQETVRATPTYFQDRFAANFLVPILITSTLRA